ncbi:MAG: hypothetical protein ABS46_16675 [Cytophagaceae bacterium SCN 52-12]|nr:MAG: hypothetical protein ABS46_16675 [Cytophagaceae bacterium SCN 52-12]
MSFAEEGRSSRAGRAGNAGCRMILLASLAMLCSFSLCAHDGIGNADTVRVRQPLKFNGRWPASPLYAADASIRFEDTLGVVHRIGRLTDKNGAPEGYVSHIETPVCSDTLCNLMDIRMFWSLSGSYWGYDTIPRKPLTKNDHIKFNEKDYEKLHELLMDEQSILRRRHKDDLFDKEAKRVSNVVDAVTGATAKEVKEAVVDGAVYSSYTIYHLVHSQLAAVIRDDVRKNLLPGLAEKLINSERADERIFLIKELEAGQLPAYTGKMIETIPMAIPIDRLYIMKKLPSASWNRKDVQVPVAEMAELLDIHSLSHFLNQLKAADTLHIECLRKLSERLPYFSVNQVRTYLSLLERDPEFLKDPAIVKAVKETAAGPGYQYRSYLESFLAKNQLQ